MQKDTYFRVRMTLNSDLWATSSWDRTVWLQEAWLALHLVQVRVSVTRL